MSSSVELLPENCHEMTWCCGKSDVGFPLNGVLKSDVVASDLNETLLVNNHKQSNSHCTGTPPH